MTDWKKKNCYYLAAPLSIYIFLCPGQRLAMLSCMQPLPNIKFEYSSARSPLKGELASFARSSPQKEVANTWSVPCRNGTAPWNRTNQPISSPQRYFYTIVYNRPFAYDTKDTFTTSLSSFLRRIRMSEWLVPWYLYHGQRSLDHVPKSFSEATRLPPSIWYANRSTFNLICFKSLQPAVFRSVVRSGREPIRTAFPILA